MAELTALQAEVVARIKAKVRARHDTLASTQAARWAIANGVSARKASSRFRLAYVQVRKQYNRLVREVRAMPAVEPFEHTS